MLTISPAAHEAIANTQPQNDNIGFGKIMAPVMYRADYQNGQWCEGQVVPYAPIEIDPAAKVLHYAQEVFEGLKAYHSGILDKPNFFRADQNFLRLNRSAERLCMPALPEKLFNEGIHSITELCQKLIPNQQGQSLYLRPFIFGTQAELGMAVSDSYIFLVIASPSDVYHSGNMRLLVERNSCRSVQGGTGSIKAGANYAMALHSARRIQSLGYHQSLWLDPKEMRYVEELSGMNLFAVINNELVTPELNDSFLPGITRDALISLARQLGYVVTERALAIEELLESIDNNSCSEIFACGTAAIISSVSCVGDDGLDRQMSESFPVAQQLREQLLAIQECRNPDPFDWIQLVDDSYIQ